LEIVDTDSICLRVALEVYDENKDMDVYMTLA
jgi:hypothetical protein